MQPLNGKVALVTGASRGIGRGIALSLAGAGADVAITYRSRSDEAAEVVRQIQALGRRAASVQTDVADREAMQALFVGVAERFGHLDIAVANASYNIGHGEVPRPVIETDWPDVRRRLEVSQYGVFHTCQLAAQQMVRQEDAGRRGGKIIIIASVHSRMPVANYAGYNMAKAAVEHLGRTLAIELAPHHINVNAILPGWIDTPGSRDIVGDAYIEGGWRRVPWGRLGAPADLGQAAAFLAGPDSDYVTGASLLVDGGWVLGISQSERQPFFQESSVQP